MKTSVRLTSGVFLFWLLLAFRSSEAAPPASPLDERRALCKAVATRWQDTNGLLDAYAVQVPGLQLQSFTEEDQAIRIDGTADSEENARELARSLESSSVLMGQGEITFTKDSRSGSYSFRLYTTIKHQQDGTLPFANCRTGKRLIPKGKDRFDNVLVELNASALTEGLRFEKFRPTTITRRSGYLELPVETILAGSYHDIRAFITRLHDSDTLIALSSIELKNMRPNSGIVQFSTTMILYAEE